VARLRLLSGVDLVTKGHFGPVIDGRLLTRDTAAAPQHRVPLLVGTNQDDGANYTVDSRLSTGDAKFVYPVWRWAKAHHETSGAPTWMYRFTRTPPIPDGIAPAPDGLPFGAYHTAELPYTGDNLRQLPWAWTDTDRELATAMADTWARFVRDGDPNGGTLPRWDTFTTADDSPVLHFGDVIKPGPLDRLPAIRRLHCQ
jgi:para-nitrobenzyl esterase